MPNLISLHYMAVRNVAYITFLFLLIGVNAHEGFDVGMQAGIALGVCFTILGSFAFIVNIIKKKCVKSIP